MWAIRTVELFYALVILGLAYFTFRFLMRSNTVNRLVDEPLAPPESDDALEAKLEIVREDVAETIQTHELQAQKSRERAKRLRRTVSSPLNA